MSIRTMAVMAACALSLTATAAYAQAPQMGGGQPGRPQGGPPRLMGEHPNGMGSTMWRGDDMRMGSSTERRPGMGYGSSTDMHGSMMRGVPGIITALGTTSFTISGRGMGADHATTTFTVNVSDATKYQHGSTTAAFTDLTVGTKVEVMGAIATSTKTITAERVVFGMEGMGPHGDMKDGMGKGGILDKLKNFFQGFGKKAGDQASTTTGSAETGASDDVVGNIMQALFGWLH